MKFALLPLLWAGVVSARNGTLDSDNPVGLAQQIVGEILRAGDCDGCQGVLASLKAISLLGDPLFVETFIEVCKISGVEDDDVCEGIVKAEAPIIAEDLRHMNIGSHTSHLLCANLLGLCPYPAVRAYDLKIPKAKVQRQRPKPSGKTPINIVHISDTHVDQSYTTGANYNCTKPICCRSYTAQDAPGNTSFPAGPWGNHLCDAPQKLMVSMFNAVNNAVNKVPRSSALTIFTGDVPAHDIWLVNREEVEMNLENTFASMAMVPHPYPATGNHDTAPVNGFPPMGIQTFSKVNPQWTYNKFSSLWQKWIGPSAANSVKSYGSYSIKHPGSNLRIISYNSIFYYTENFWMYTDPMIFDPDNQFAWFIKELQAAETAGERVWLISHVPPGNNDHFRDYSAYFNRIIQRYSGTIAATFHGHTHDDQFEISYSNFSNPTAKGAKMVSYIAPSLTPTSGSPSFRIYSVDPETYAVLDFTQYIANISDPTYQTKGPTWKKYYSAKQTYGSLLTPPYTDPKAELTPAFWHNVTKVFEQNDAAFQGYFRRQSRGYDSTTCTGDCKKLEICGMRAANSEFNCNVPTPGFHFSKKKQKRESSDDLHQHDDCGESKIKLIFQGLSRNYLRKVDHIS